MAGAIVNVVVEQLILAAQHWVKEEISLLKGVKLEIENMKTKMLIIQTVVEDAENQSVKKKIVKLWLEKLQDVSYDMDDVLDEWSTRVLILKRDEAEENNIEIVGSSSSTSATTCFSLKELNCFSTVKQLPWRRKIAKRIKDINERVNLLCLNMEQFKLAKKGVGNADLDKIINPIGRITTSLIDESKVYGRDIDKMSLLSKVLSMNNKQEKSFQVISIFGAGGLGKTTLAQMVYNDGKVKKKFGEKRIWVCVSDPFDEVKVAKDILEGLKLDHSKMNSLETLHRSVEESLSRHKFLLVLDDVWDEHFQKWENLRECFKHSDPDSRVLVTTRKEKVARIMGTTETNILKPQHISYSDCWFLMSQIAFQGRTDKDDEQLQEIGKNIAKKCKGLPLAAKTLGGMLISKDSIDDWKQILNSEIWELEEAKVDLFPHIFLSYQELPAVLKHCFLILAIFPKDTKLSVHKVIAIWMAHGFLNQGTKEVDMVKTGKKYLKFLVSRALLEENYFSDISMHDIMHDFALHVSGDELISIDKIKNDSGSMSTARHLYIEGNIDPASIGFNVGKLRTCIIRNVAANVTSDLVKRLKMVRALYLVDCDLERLPPSIESLIHLRLLELRRNPLLVELPETIDGLYNLQQLYLEGSGVSTLPNSVGKLSNLIFLKHDDKVLKKLPQSVGKLINLQELGVVEVGAGNNKLGLLKDLNQLRELRISFNSVYGDEVDEVDAKEAAIGRKEHITELELDFHWKEVTDGVIAALQPHSNIQLLKIYSLPRSCVMLPRWITFLDHLTELQLWGGGNVSTLPSLGKLQSLKNLEIYNFEALKMIGREFLGIDDRNNNQDFVAFRNLLKLRFRNCPLLSKWEDLKRRDKGKVIMPKLQYLEISGWPQLQVLPSKLLCGAASLKELNCYRSYSLATNIKKDKKLLKHVKNVNVDGEHVYKGTR